MEDRPMTCTACPDLDLPPRRKHLICTARLFTALADCARRSG
jgi:hypothetical protein